MDSDELKEKDHKRNPVFQPKPRDIVGCGDTQREVVIIEENCQGIFVTWNENGILGGETSIQEWQAWAKDADFIRRRKK